MSKSGGARADCKIGNIRRKHFQNSEYFQVSRPTLSLFAALYVRVVLLRSFSSLFFWLTFFHFFQLGFFLVVLLSISHPFFLPFSSAASHFAHTLTHSHTATSTHAHRPLSQNNPISFLLRPSVIPSTLTPSPTSSISIAKVASVRHIQVISTVEAKG